MTEERKNEIWAMLTQEEKSKYSKEYNAPTEDDWDSGYEAALQSIFGRHNLTAQAEEKPLFKSNYKAGDKVVITGSLCGSKGKTITLVRQYDCPREANDYQNLWVGQFEDGHTCSIAEKDFTPTVEFEQAEEKPKESDIDGKFHIGDKVITIACCPYYKKGMIGVVVNCHDSDVDIDANGIRYYRMPLCDLAPYTEPKVDGKISDKKSLLDRVIDAGYNFLDRHNPDVIPERGISNIDYTRYRLDLAKEIAVAVIKSDRWDFHSCNPVEQANEIVKRLKETDNAD